MPTNSLNDEGGEEGEKKARSPDHILMDVEFPQVQLHDYPMEGQVRVEPISTRCPFTHP